MVVKQYLPMLLQKADLWPQDIDRVLLYGALPRGCSGEELCAAGFLPEVLADKLYCLGNAPLQIAVAALMQEDVRRRAEKLAARVNVFDPLAEVGWEDGFAAALFLAVLTSLHPYLPAAQKKRNSKKFLFFNVYIFILKSFIAKAANFFAAGEMASATGNAIPISTHCFGCRDKVTRLSFSSEICREFTSVTPNPASTIAKAASSL